MKPYRHGELYLYDTTNKYEIYMATEDFYVRKIAFSYSDTPFESPDQIIFMETLGNYLSANLETSTLRKLSFIELKIFLKVLLENMMESMNVTKYFLAHFHIHTMNYKERTEVFKNQQTLIFLNNILKNYLANA